MSYTIEPLPYLKAVLHAAKFPSSTVIGLLVGQQDSTTQAITIQDAIPLLHHWTDLSPLMEVSLQLAEIHVRKQGKVFVGLYVANSKLEDTSIPSSVAAVADALKKELPQTLVLVVDNQKLGSSSPAFVPYTYSGSSWTSKPFESPSFTLSDLSTPTKTLEQVKAGKHSLVEDFDEHVEDPRVDWLANPKITW